MRTQAYSIAPWPFLTSAHFQLPLPWIGGSLSIEQAPFLQLWIHGRQSGLKFGSFLLAESSLQHFSFLSQPGLQIHLPLPYLLNQSPSGEHSEIYIQIVHSKCWVKNAFQTCIRDVHLSFLLTESVINLVSTITIERANSSCYRIFLISVGTFPITMFDVWKLRFVASVDFWLDLTKIGNTRIVGPPSCFVALDWDMITVFVCWNDSIQTSKQSVQKCFSANI